jgi:hypothetical protein
VRSVVVRGLTTGVLCRRKKPDNKGTSVAITFKDVAGVDSAKVCVRAVCVYVCVRVVCLCVCARVCARMCVNTRKRTLGARCAD